MALTQITFLISSILGIILPFFSAITNSQRTAYIAAALSIPICFYVAGAPTFYYVPLIFPILTVMGGYLLPTRRTLAIWLLLSPHIISTLLSILGYLGSA